MNQHEHNLGPSRPATRPAALLLLLAAILAACGNAEPTASPSAAAEPSGTAAGQACAAEDLAVAGGPWSAAAGSRGADVIVENQGDSACTLPATAEVVVTDAGSQPVLESAAAGSTAGPTLDAGASAAFTVLVSNWCDEVVALPLHVVVRLGDAAIQVPGLDLTSSDLPPCNGPGQPPTLTVNDWAMG